VKHTLCALAAVAALGIAASPASAQVARGAPALAQSSDGAVQTVQWRRHGHWRGHHRYHRRGYGWGPAVGGFAAGAIIGGALAAQQAQAAQQQDWIAYCSAKYQSFNPATGTYIANSGKERPCR
jgi:uncharacterized protein YcfJ